MGIVHEEIRNNPVTLMVVEKQQGEWVDPWRIITLDADHFERLTPRELRELGRWLVGEGKRIGKEYTSKGAKRKP